MQINSTTEQNLIYSLYKGKPNMVAKKYLQK